MLYLSDYKKYPKIINNAQVAEVDAVLDTLDADVYRTVKYNLTVEDTYTNDVYQCRLTMTHDSLSAQITEFDVINGNLDLSVDAVYTDVVGGYPTKFEVQTTFPVDFNGSWSLDKEVFINISDVQKSGLDGPSVGIYPSPYTYPNS